MKYFIISGAIKIKKVIQDFFFSDLRAGDVTVEMFENKLTKLFARSIPTIVLVLTMLGNDHTNW